MASLATLIWSLQTLTSALWKQYKGQDPYKRLDKLAVKYKYSS
jgi:hypothetical protein